jgi:hypothetical protein
MCIKSRVLQKCNSLFSIGYGGSKCTKSRARGKLAARKSEDFRHFLPSGGRFGGRLWTLPGRFSPHLTLCSNYITDGWTDKGVKSSHGRKSNWEEVLEGEASMRPHAQKCRGFEGFDPSAGASEASFPTPAPPAPGPAFSPRSALRSHERRSGLQFVPFSRARAQPYALSVGAGRKGASQTCRMIPSVLGARCAAACSAGRQGVMAAAGAPVISAIGSSVLGLSGTSNATQRGDRGLRPEAAHLSRTSRSRQSSTGVFGAVPGSYLCRVWLDLMLAGLAPHDQANLGRSGIPQRHRRFAVRFQSFFAPSRSFARRLTKAMNSNARSGSSLINL